MAKNKRKSVCYTCGTTLRASVIALSMLAFNGAVFAEKTQQTNVNINAQAQKTKVQGVVVDANGEPLVGVSVVEDGSTNGFITDAEGRFELQTTTNAVLKVSYVGYNTQKVRVNGQHYIKVELKEDSKTLNDVVVVGYGTMRKVDLAGSVAVVGNKSFKDQPITRAADALQGRVSGVQVENSGIPGGAVKIRVRGTGSINKSNDPLYVVDGIVRESGLDGINPEDIESIQILKDASSTAIYGARGSNGVVMITTKSGKSGNKQIVFDASVGIANVTKRYDVLNAYEYAQALKDIKGINDFSAEQLEAFKNGKAGIDWQNELFRTGWTQNYKLAFSNGTDKTQYYISANYMQQDGVIIDSNFRRYQAKANISSQLTDWLHVSADINAAHNIRKGGGLTRDNGNPLWQALNYSPTLSMFAPNGLYSRDSYNSIGANPVGSLRANKSEFMTDMFNGKLEFKFNILKGLTFTSTNGIDYNDSKNYFLTSHLVASTNGMSNADNYRMMLQTSNTLNYNADWDKHHLNATAVYEATTSEARMMDITGKKMINEAVGWWNIASSQDRDGSNGYTKWTLQSVVGRVVYNFNDKYRVTGTLRADGSSRFTNKKWGYFPSIAGAWTVSNEEFMKNVKVVEDIKIRASYGVVGNQAIDPYSTLALISTSGYGWGSSSLKPAWSSFAIDTPDVTWENTKQMDFGFDFSLLHKRLKVGFDYFDKISNNALILKELPRYKGGGKYWVNDGVISNKGFEVSLDANIINTDNLSWNSTLNVSYIKNKVKKLAGGADDFSWGSKPAPGMVDYATIIKPGYAVGTFWGYKWLGLDKDGKDMYEDRNGNGRVDGNDRTNIGKSSPDVTFGWNNSVSYKNWDLNIFATSAIGAKRLNLVRFGMASMVGSTRFITLRDAYAKSFDKIGAAAIYPSLKTTGNTYEAVSTKWLENANYLRLENISLSYNMPKKVAKFADLRFTLSCQNLFTITSYSGYDPTGSNFSEGNIDVDGGVDIGAYPTPRTITLGVRMNF